MSVYTPKGPIMSQPMPTPGPSKMSAWAIALITIGCVFATVIAVLVGAAIISAAAGSGSTITSSAAEPGGGGGDLSSSSPEPESDGNGYQPSNFDLTLEFKQKSKECYSYGWGCNVTGDVRIKAYRVMPPSDGTITVYYRLKGDKEGPIDGTLTVSCDGRQSTYQPDYQYLSTASRSKKVTVEVTQVEYVS